MGKAEETADDDWDFTVLSPGISRRGLVIISLLD
jgi:hypothetical protein